VIGQGRALYHRGGYPHQSPIPFTKTLGKNLGTSSLDPCTRDPTERLGSLDLETVGMRSMDRSTTHQKLRWLGERRPTRGVAGKVFPLIFTGPKRGVGLAELRGGEHFHAHRGALLPAKQYTNCGAVTEMGDLQTLLFHRPDSETTRAMRDAWGVVIEGSKRQRRDWFAGELLQFHTILPPRLAHPQTVGLDKRTVTFVNPLLTRSGVPEGCRIQKGCLEKSECHV